jgi:hypothetical protein
MKTLENDDTSFKEADLRKYLSNYSSDLFTFFHNVKPPTRLIE